MLWKIISDINFFSLQLLHVLRSVYVQGNIENLDNLE